MLVNDVFVGSEALLGLIQVVGVPGQVTLFQQRHLLSQLHHLLFEDILISHSLILLQG